MKNLDQKELVKMLSDFYGDDFINANNNEKQKYIDSYRKVEFESNEQIKKHGSVKNWYASGEGRLL